MLFAQILERHLDALIIEFLIVGTKLVAATSGAVEELGYLADRSVGFAFKLGRAANVDGAVEIKVVDIVIELSHDQALHGLVANAQDLAARAHGSYVLVTPTNFVVETEAGNRSAIGVELNPFSAGQIVAQALRQRHFHAGH